jgi:hypothetical protein
LKAYYYLFIFLVVLMGNSFAQETTLEQFNNNRNVLNHQAMLTLGGWAMANIIGNSALYFNSDAGHRKPFYQMNAAWNVVNLAIAGFGYYGSIHPDTNLTLFESLREQSNLENILLFNAGLDIGYIMTGFFLIEKSKTSDKHQARWKGYGQSLTLQGGFLFVFDAVVFYLQNRNHKLAADLLAGVHLNPHGLGLTFYF